MTNYAFQSNQVDLKADNMHASARPADTLSNNDLTGGKTVISAGAVVISAANGRIDIGAGNDTNVVGVATQTRSAGDTRPLTYTRSGLVHVAVDGSAIVAGSRLKNGTQGLVGLAAANGSEANLEIGKCIEISSQVAGTVIVMQLTL